MADREDHAIAVIGGAAAGAEAAGIFSNHGILTTVFEQNDRPYGKIEDGLPKWHVALRKKEYRSIDQKLVQPHVHFVPRTRIGPDITLRELTGAWGFHAVVLANGAWRDRPLPIDGADAYLGRGLIYQNPFIRWFNHYREPDYDGESFDILDGTIVIGGGLGSIDVVKVLQLELTLRALRERGIDSDLVRLDTKGIPSVLAEYGLDWDSLGLEGCTLFYRRRIEDMPLVSLPANATDAQREKVGKARQRLIEKAVAKYLFRIEPRHTPVELIVENGRLVGLVLARTRLVDGRVELTDETISARGPLVISSIGSIPEPMGGIPMRGELYDFADGELGRLTDFPTLFSAGNVVTGKGNIVASRKHARQVSGYMTEHYLKLTDAVQRLDPLSSDAYGALLERIRARQTHVGYDADYRSWIDRVAPSDVI